VPSTGTCAARVSPVSPCTGLRHSYATAALVAGVETKLVSERLGHSSTAITSDVYTHVPVGMQENAARRVAALILEG
jgi:integrase